MGIGQAMLTFFAENPATIGERDLVVTHRWAHDDAVLACMRGLLVPIADEGVRFPRVYLVVPPGVPGNVVSALREPTQSDRPTLQDRVELVTARDRSAAALAAAVVACPEGSAVVCAFAHLYGSGRVTECTPDVISESVTGEAVRQHSAERLIAHELMCIGEAQRDQVATKEVYAVCVAGCGWLGDALTDAVMEPYGTVLVLAENPSPTSPLARLQDWADAIRGGTAPEAVHSAIIESGVDEARAREVLALALYRGGRPRPAYALFTEVVAAADHDIDAEFLVMGARIAIDAGRRKDAVKLIERVCADPYTPAVALRMAAQAARTAGDPELRLRTATLLHEAVPGDPEGAILYADQLLRRGGFAEAVGVLAPHVGRLNDEGKYLLALASHRARADAGGVGALIAAVPSGMVQRAVADAIFIATAKRAWDEVDAALEHAVSEGVGADQAVRAACAATLAWALRPDSNGDGFAQPGRWIAKVAELVALHPGDAMSRLRLEDALGANGLGEVPGLASLLPLIMEPADLGASEPSPDLVPGTPNEMLAFGDFFQRVMPKRKRRLLVPKRLEEDVSPSYATELIAGGHGLLEGTWAAHEFGADDVACILSTLELMLDVIHTAHGSATTRGGALAVRLIHYAAAGIAMRGSLQHARDLVETAMRIADGATDSGVLADSWLAFADVSLRSHNATRATMALAVASRTLPSDPARRARFHAYATRALREVGLLDAAALQLDAMQAVATAHPHACHPQEARTLRWSLVVSRAAQRGRAQFSPSEVTALTDVCGEALETMRSEMEAPPNRAVAATFLLQATELLRLFSHPRPANEGADEAVALAGRLGPRAAHAAVPTIDNLRQTVEASLTARYGDDVVTDARAAQVLARRLLATPSSDIVARAAALEVIADLETGFESHAAEGDMTVAQDVTERLFEHAKNNEDIEGIVDLLETAPGVGTVPRLGRVIADPDAHLVRLESCAREGLLLDGLVLAGEHVGRLRVFDGKATWTLEPSEVFDPRRLHEYGMKYPYGYSASTTSGYLAEEEVRASLVGLGFSAIDDATTLRCVVPDPRLLALPANLHMLGEVLSGDLVPTCQAPSLSWLLDAHERRNDVVPWSASAWTLREDTEVFAAPITTGADGLEEELGPLGVSLTRNALLREIVAAPVTWLVGHGGLGPDGRHFTRVSDDLGNLSRAEHLVSSCRGARLVVLLVCSGGRASLERFEERARGLPFELLRAGVQTVVASPWPLDVLVGVKWSKLFAARLLAGDWVASAAFEANRGALGNRPPKDRLAMHVYGDPWLRVQR